MIIALGVGLVAGLVAGFLLWKLRKRKEKLRSHILRYKETEEFE